MKLLVIVPAYNEEDTIAALLERVLAVNLDRLGVEKQIVVVDDGSTDRTTQIVKEHFPGVALIRNAFRQGKGAAIIRALNSPQLQADLALIQDADLEYDPSFYPQLLEPIIKGQSQVVYGSRFLTRRYPPGMQFLNWLGNYLGVWIVNFLYGARLTDLMTGYKVFSWRLLKSLVLSRRGFDICPQITSQLLKKKIKIYEVPISYQGRSRLQGKKITFQDAFFILSALWEYRFKD